MRNLFLMFAPSAAVLLLVIWVLWRHALPVLIVGTLLIGLLRYLVSVEKGGRDPQVS